MSFISDAVFNLLSSHPNEQFTAREISNWIFENFPEKCNRKQFKSQNKLILNATTSEFRNNALKTALSAEIGAQRNFMQNKHPEIRTSESRPRKYYFSIDTDVVEVQKAEATGVEKSGVEIRLTEHDVYPLLTRYLYVELNLLSKRINEKRSKNGYGAGGNKWLHPDVVALEDLTGKWNDNIKACVNDLSQRCKLWSFEVKLLLNRSNVREAFFQTISNSSWASHAYLVSTAVKGADTMDELRMLCNSHGIGFILLDIENPLESNIEIPAKEQWDIDWDMVNRIAQENTDFLDYIKEVRQFFQTGDLKKSDWDKVVLDTEWEDAA